MLIILHAACLPVIICNTYTYISMYSTYIVPFPSFSPKFRMSLITFDDKDKTKVHVQITSDRDRINQTISDLYAGSGRTFLKPAITKVCVYTYVCLYMCVCVYVCVFVHVCVCVCVCVC